VQPTVFELHTPYAAVVATDTLSVVRLPHSGGHRPIVLLHGFTQNARCWGPFGEELAQLGPVFAIDLPGHGGSSAIDADLDHSARLIAETIDELALDRPPCVIGYSLGGRTALHLALARPDLVGQLVLIGATAGIENDIERADRQRSDEQLADRIIELGVASFLDEWLSQPLFATLAPEQAEIEPRLDNTAAGLRSSLRRCGTGTQRSLWSELPALSMPVLVIAGERDSKFRTIAERLVEAIGSNASAMWIRDAGHSAHLERPFETFQVINGWAATATGQSPADEEAD